MKPRLRPFPTEAVFHPLVAKVLAGIK